jgi:hypothetical protein
MIFMQENLEYYENHIRATPPKRKSTQSVSEIDSLMVQATESRNKVTKKAVSNVKKIRANYRTRKNMEKQYKCCSNGDF